jgi:hypothetical protein
MNTIIRNITSGAAAAAVPVMMMTKLGDGFKWPLQQGLWKPRRRRRRQRQGFSACVVPARHQRSMFLPKTNGWDNRRDRTASALTLDNRRDRTASALTLTLSRTVGVKAGTCTRAVPTLSPFRFHRNACFLQETWTSGTRRYLV